jgi:hypothetical protein
MAKLVRKLADGFGLPSTFTLDACRHGGMTELEEAELTTGQGRAEQSAIRTPNRSRLSRLCEGHAQKACPPARER